MRGTNRLIGGNFCNTEYKPVADCTVNVEEMKSQPGANMLDLDKVAAGHVKCLCREHRF